jgi:hypothetical protein
MRSDLGQYIAKSAIVKIMKFFRNALSNPQSHQGLLPMVGLFLFALLAAVMTGLGSYRYQRVVLEKQAKEELSYLAQAQRDHLELWQSERLKDSERA